MGNRIFYIVIVLAAVFAGDLTGPRVRSAEGEQPRFALLIGISKYDKNTPAPIEGCVNNVEALRDTLVGDYGFGSNVLTLLNESARRNDIKAAFRSHLIENAKKAKAAGKEAVIVYYFCGHGSQYPDENGDEADGKDETFVAWDSRTTGHDLLDDEIDDLNFDLRKHTANATFILESCHSGTGTRNGDPVQANGRMAQQVGDDTRKHPFTRKNPNTENTQAETFVTISAAHSSRVALSETAAGCQCEKPMGLMTRALVHSLKSAGPATTYRGLVREVSARLASMNSDQDPQIEGNRDAVLFGNAASRAKPYIEIENIDDLNKFGTIVIRAGAAHGLKEGSLISIYSSDSKENTGKNGWLTNGYVARAGSVSSVVQLPPASANPAIKEVKITSHAVLASPAFGGGPLQIVLEQSLRSAGQADVSKKIEERLKAEGLFDSRLIELAPAARQDAAGRSVSLRRAKMKELFDYSNSAGSGLAPLSRRAPSAAATYCRENELNVRTADERFYPADKEVFYLDTGEIGAGPLFGKAFDPSDPAAADDIAASIRSYALQQNLRALDNAVSELPKQIEVELELIPEDALIEKCVAGQKVREPNGDKFADFIKVREDPVSGYQVPAGSFAKMTVRNASGRYLKAKGAASGMRYHISVLALSTNGDISVAAGSTGANEALEDGAETVVYFKAGELAGTERFVIMITADPADFSFFKSTGTKRNSRSPLETLLTGAGTRTRNSNIVPDGPDKWGVKRFEINLTPIVPADLDQNKPPIKE